MTQIRILYEDGEALVIDKPSGLPIERPRRGGKSLDDHLDGLKLGFQRLPLPVHRLDTDTSGCLLLARTPKAPRSSAGRTCSLVACTSQGSGPRASPGRAILAGAVHTAATER